MGDRALVVFHNNSGEVSPTVYLHWNGYEAIEWLKEAAPNMCSGDMTYATARFVQFCGNKIEGGLSLGLMSTPAIDKVREEAYSHGDAGVIMVSMDTGEITAHGGYVEGHLLNDPVTLEFGKF